MQNKEFEYLFQAEETDLLKDLRSLPGNAATRKINEMVKRARVLRTHALILSQLKSQMPSMFGKEKKQKQLIDNLADTFNQVNSAFLGMRDWVLYRFIELCKPNRSTNNIKYQ